MNRIARSIGASSAVAFLALMSSCATNKPIASNAVKPVAELKALMQEDQKIRDEYSRGSFGSGPDSSAFILSNSTQLRNEKGQLSTVKSPTLFIHNQERKDEFGKRIPENEFNVKAYYHPGIVVDNINGNQGKVCEGDTVGLGYQSSLIFRAKGKSAWQVTSDYENNAQLDFSIRQVGGKPFFETGNSAERILLKRVKSGALGKGTDLQNYQYGNTQLQGLMNIHGVLTLYDPAPKNSKQANRFHLGTDDKGVYLKQSYRASGKGTGMRFFVGGESTPTLTLSADVNAKKNYRVKVNGSALASGYWVDSDARFKGEISDIQVAQSTDDLLLLQPKQYRYLNSEERNFDRGLTYGFVAQELQQVLPELVRVDENGFMSVNYIALIPILTKAYQGLEGKTAHIAEKQLDQETELSKLKEENKQLKKEIEEIKELLKSNSQIMSLRH